MTFHYRHLGESWSPEHIEKIGFQPPPEKPSQNSELGGTLARMALTLSLSRGESGLKERLQKCSLSLWERVGVREVTPDQSWHNSEMLPDFETVSGTSV